MPESEIIGCEKSERKKYEGEVRIERQWENVEARKENEEENEPMRGNERKNEFMIEEENELIQKRK